MKTTGIWSGKLKNKGIFLKLLLSYLGTAVFSILVIGLLFSYWSSKQATQDISSMAKLALSNICMTITNAFDAARTTTYEMYNTPEINSLLVSNPVDRDHLSNASLFLYHSFVSNPSIDSVYIFNGNSIALSVGGHSNFSEDADQISSLILSQRILYPIHRNVVGKNGKSLELYTFIYHEPSTNSNAPMPSVLINVRAENIHELVFPELSDSNQDLIITDDRANILLSNRTPLSSASLSGEAYYQTGVKQNEDWIYYKALYKGSQHIVNYFNFGEGKYKAFLVSDYNTFFQKILHMRNAIILTCLSVLLVILCLSIYFSFILFVPINNLFASVKKYLNPHPAVKNTQSEVKYVSGIISRVIEKLNSYEQDQHNHDQIMYKSFIHELFSTKKHLEDNYLLESLIKYKLLTTTRPFYCILVLRIGDYQQFRTVNSPSSIDFLLDSIENITCQILQPTYEISPCKIDNEHIVFITAAQEEFNKDFMALLKTAQSTIHQLLHIEATIGRSDVFSQMNTGQLRDKYSQAYGMTNYRLLLGKSEIFSNDTLNFDQRNMDTLTYRLDVIVNLVKSASLELYKEQLTALFTDVKLFPYERAIHIFYRLAQSIQEISAKLNALHERSSSEQLFQILKSFETYEELQLWFVQLFEQTNEILQSVKNNKTQDLVESVVDYLKNHYADPSISANLMAERLAVTPQYFSRIFKEYTGSSFPDYLSHIRLEKAKDLLNQGGEMNITEICEQIGFANKPYFTTSFTKKYGVSPTKYKLSNKLSQN